VNKRYYISAAMTIITSGLNETIGLNHGRDDRPYRLHLSLYMQWTDCSRLPHILVVFRILLV